MDLSRVTSGARYPHGGDEATRQQGVTAVPAAGCPKVHCYAPDASCDLGHLDVSNCPEWKKRDDGDSLEVAQSDEIGLPWSGSAIGLVDLGFIAGRSKPIVVGVAGPEKAGKTTLLASWYLLLGRGALSKRGHRFTGSFTLDGWEAVASAMRWDPGRPAGFPPHTTSRSGRIPGLLHLAFNTDLPRPRDFLFTDAPGEWFQKWAVNRDAKEGAGAQWVADHADVLLLVADREALSAGDQGLARGALQLLARRIAAERRDAPVALVWTKADVEISAAMKDSVHEAVFNVMPDAAEFSITIASDRGNEGTGILELFDWVLSIRRGGVSLPPPRGLNTDPLFLVGSR
jgi:hypothetical protein